MVGQLHDGLNVCKQCLGDLLKDAWSPSFYVTLLDDVQSGCWDRRWTLWLRTSFVALVDGGCGWWCVTEGTWDGDQAI